MTQTWGLATDTPVPADYDGDGKTDLAVFRPSTATWWILLSSTNYTNYMSRAWGLGTDMPVPGDYDGDGKTDIAVYRPSTATWFILQSSTNYTTWIVAAWGARRRHPGAGRLRRRRQDRPRRLPPLDRHWYILQSSTQLHDRGSSQAWGRRHATSPVPGDYDGDGKTDLAVFRPSTGHVVHPAVEQQLHDVRARSSGASAPTSRCRATTTATARPTSRSSALRPGTWFILKSSTNFTTFISQAWGSALTPR